MPFFTPATADTWPAVTAQMIAQYLNTALETQDRASLVVPGGRTAAQVLPLLAAQPLDWTRIDITLSDERWVDADHRDSNEGQLRRCFAATPDATIVGLKTAGDEPETALPDCLERLSAVPRPFDVVLLGMGEDGHTASLFPGQAIAPGDMQVAQRPDHPRVSLTPQCLLDSRHIVLPVSGETKRRVFDAALEPGPAEDYPIRHVLHQRDVDVAVILG